MLYSGSDTRADNDSAQANTQRKATPSQTMLDRWANETMREELPFTEVIQQPDAEYVFLSLF